jgi:glycine/D-amino acid oxidase-like deaminating enzyme
MQNLSPEEHCQSYYAASINTSTTYPTLSDSVSVDVCVIGAGFTGVSTALTLAERGFSVAVLEANRVGWGASGRNGGQLIGGFSGASKLIKYYGDEIAEKMWDMQWRGNDIIRDRVKKYNIDCDLKPGFLDVARNPKQMEELEEDCRTLQQQGFAHELRLLDKAELEKTIGTLKYFGGLINYGNGHLHPLNLCRGEARAATELGVHIFEQSPVVEINHGDRNRVICASGEVDCTFVVLAGNAYHKLEKKRLAGILFPANSYIIATEPLAEHTLAEINPLDLAVCDVNNVPDYYRLSADKRMLFGGISNYSGRDLRDIKKCLLPRMLRIYPQLEGSRIEYQWGGTMGIIIKRVVHMGRTDENIFYSQGYSGHGVSATHLAGEIMADAVEGKYDRLELFENYPHIPIPLGTWAGNQIVAIGMLYYKLLDLL